MRALGQDLRFGLRALLRRPGLVAGAILILGLGIGAAVTVASVIDAFFLRALPYAQADRLVWIRSISSGAPLGVSHADYLDWKAARPFASLALFNANEYSVLTVGGESESVLATRTDSSLFPTLGVRMFLGRPFSAGDDRPGAGNALLISHDLWRRRFGADSHVLGRGVVVDGAPYTVVGVLPAGFHFPVRSDLWLPSSAWADQWPWRNIRVDTVVGRLRPGVTIEAARVALRTVALRLQHDHPDTNSGIQADLTPLREVWTGTSRSGLFLLLAACGFLLLIAGANVANLLLVWAQTREREAAVRIAIGIQPLRQVRQAACEALLLGLASGAAGLLLAFWGVRLVAWLLPGQLPSWVDVRLSLRSAAFALAVSLGVGLLAAIAPMLRSLNAQPRTLLQQGGRTAGASREKSWGRRSLAVAQIAFTLPLLVSAGLTLKSFTRLQAIEPGFKAAGVLALDVHLPVFKLESLEQVTALYHRILDQTAALPGVVAAGAATDLPLARKEERNLWEFGIAGQTAQERLRNPRAYGHVVSPGYFSALRIPILKGRTLEPRDSGKTPGAIVSRSFAERFWPNREALGQRLSLGPVNQPAPPVTIVGVVDNVRYESLAAASDTLDLYFPLDSLPSWPIHLVLRARGNPENLAPAVRREFRKDFPDLGLRDVAPLTERVARSVWQERIWATLFPIFSILALLLASAGVYTVISQRVYQRTREMSIRIALGAERRDVLRTLLGEVFRLSALGIAIGFVAALLIGRFLTALLFEVRAGDLSVLTLAVLALATVCLAAAYAPVRRALRVEPATVLRTE